MSDGVKNQDFMSKTLRENWRREMEAAFLYQGSARNEKDPRRKEILQKLADIEFRHAEMWVERMEREGVSRSELKPPVVEVSGKMPLQVLMKQIEEVENGNAAWYQSLRNVVEDEDFVGILDQIDKDEADHQDMDALFVSPTTPENRLKKLWRGERHNHGKGDWVGDAIYGVNDGLGAIFGIISGVAGYTLNTHTVLISGLFGALASTLSMGAGAFLATKSENEVNQTTLEQEKREIEDDEEHEIEELALLYELKGFDSVESQMIAEKIAEDKDQFLKTMVQEEFGFHEANQGNPWRSAIFGGASTFVGGIIPLVPFFFTGGWTALILAAVVSILAHFAVGAAKSIITVRGWFSSGLEMTLVGVIVGVGSYLLGILAFAIFGTQLG